ncbi:helix-turn-helix transcriptional regulator, putative [Citrifermentans bemidjiense Bem]|uniref:Helix-turn-helix transcriptional regulator, putative n=1 Tax=Citrifermentans bemidjiense (strain ATCC BAA-1014 / DSM 16622 / JCM 12645 / Bem) TaxID=404380 RepID=B5EHY5_CITBB|nr:transcriptional regulator [Citrifermentans bemidjiense]ACH39784.1 helix-turn-helix transcriptional regulator, putative [Citrifermentans bemidjiense Bem]
MTGKGRPAKKYSQAGRVHDVIRLIEARHGISISELAEETGVNKRTIHRDLAAIQEAGYPLISDWQDGEKVYRFLTRFKDVPPISFTLQELMTLSLLRSQLDLLKGTPFLEDMQSVFRKVNSVLPPRLAAHMERIAEVSLPLLQGKRDYSRCAESLQTIRHALLYQHSIVITYQPPNRPEPVEYLVDPYTLLFQKGGIYLLGYAQQRQALRTFAVERIAKVEPRQERFEIPEGFRPGQALGGAFGIVAEPPMDVVIHFSAGIAHAIKDRVWHASQQVKEERDGSLTLTFHAGGKMEILSWLLSYGAHAELISPPELREELTRLVQDTSRLYQTA